MTCLGLSGPLTMISFKHVIEHLVISWFIYMAFLASYIFGVWVCIGCVCVCVEGVVWGVLFPCVP